MKSSWNANRIPSQAGRRVLITGANSGIGFETALELARKGAEVILPARTEAKAADAIARIRTQVPNAKLVAERLDLADQASVRSFADRVKARFPGQSLDLLINNAGVMALPKRELTKDGFERQIATNFFGPFVLTALLLENVKQQPGARVVTVASTAANFGKIEFDNLQSERVYKPMFQAYGQTKLANLLFSFELQRRLQAAGWPILATAAHPGYAVTNLQHDDLPLMMKLGTLVLKPLLSQDAAHGALPTLYAAISPDAKAAGYYGPDGFQELKGLPTASKIPAAALDEAVAKRLWSEAERLTGVSFSI